MNEEQNIREDESESNKASQATGDAQQQDDYYAVDHGKKDVLSTIGDGEMHDEGLVGAGEATTDIQSSTERLSDEQDLAESHDSEQ